MKKVVYLTTCSFFSLSTSLSLADDVYPQQPIPSCTGKNYKEVISAYTEQLNESVRKRFILALSRLDAWYNVNAEAEGLHMTTEQTNDFLAKAVCGRKADQVEELSRRMMSQSRQ
jgi:hypothetical protein